ncbi:MAG: hypothetical protein P4M11_14780 [Candidatus Pacebacteria bacterium]|nr:hypothetical protein [Candidatus Paceibacterota bacterium]
MGCRLKIVEEEYGKDTDIKRGASVVMAFTLRSRATPAKIHVDSIGGTFFP